MSKRRKEQGEKKSKWGWKGKRRVRLIIARLLGADLASHSSGSARGSCLRPCRRASLSGPLGTWQKFVSWMWWPTPSAPYAPPPTRPSSGQERGFPQPAKKRPNKAACTTPVIKLPPKSAQGDRQGGHLIGGQSGWKLRPIHNWCVCTITGLQTWTKCCTRAPQGLLNFICRCIKSRFSAIRRCVV